MYIELLICILRYGYIEVFLICYVKYIVVDKFRFGVLVGFDLVVWMIINIFRIRVFFIGKLICFFKCCCIVDSN